MKFIRNNLVLKVIVLISILALIFAGCNNRSNERETDGNPDVNTATGKPTVNDSNITENEQTPVRMIRTPEPIYAENIAEILNNTELDDDIKALLNVPIEYQKLPETTNSRLHSALEAGDITEEEHSEYLILSGVLPEAVPLEYRGDESIEHINYAYEYIYDNWDNLSEEIKTAVEPFMVSIDDPKSYYYSDGESKTYEKQSFNFLSSVNAATPVKTLIQHEFLVEGKKVTIQYYEEDSWSADKKMDFNMCVNDIEDAMYHSYSTHKTLLTLDLSKPILIEIIPLKRGTWGQTWQETDEYRIQLSSKKIADAVAVKATIAHELFHDFQMEMGLKYKKSTDVKWLMEATAVWAEHNTYEEFNTEHEYLETFFRTLNDDLISFGNAYEYSGYMPFYYFSDYGAYNIVPDILGSTAREGSSAVRDYLTSRVSDMRNQYAQYAFYNINVGVAKEYFDYGDIKGKPSGRAYRSKCMNVDETETETVALMPGGIQYYFYDFNSDQEIKQVNFKFGEKFGDNKYIKRQALIKIDEQWYLEDWSDQEEQSFCKLSELKDENVKAVMLIYSNANFKKNGINNPIETFQVETRRCPDEMKITIDATYTQKGDGSSWSSSASITDTVKIIDNSIYVSGKSTYKVEGAGISDGMTIVTTEGSGNSSVSDPKIDNSMVRLMMPFDDSFDDMKKVWEEYGIKENIPKGGILITVPSVDEGNLHGVTTFHLPEPVGSIQIDSPLPLDGLSQITSVIIPEDAWGPNGFETELTIDYFNYKPPILGMFDIDFSKFTNMLDDMGLGGMPEMPEMPEMPDIPDMPAFSQPPGGLGDLGDLLPGDSVSGDDSIGDTLNAITSFMAVPDSASGITVTIELKISGEYTKYK